MTTVSCSDSDKERFEAMQEPGENQAETMNRILDMAEAFEGDIIDETELAEETAEVMGPKLELAMKRVANEMKEEVVLEYNSDFTEETDA